MEDFNILLIQDGIVLGDRLHWNEAPANSGWKVMGDHWIWFPGQPYPSYILPATNAIDCNIYDGWWD